MFEPPELPAQLRQVLDAEDGFDADALGYATPEHRAEWIVGLRRLIDRAEAKFQKTLATFDSNGDAEVLAGARSTASWLTGTLHLAPADASQRVRLARREATQLEPTMALLETDRITFDHVRAIGAATRQLPTEAIDAGVTILNELATHTDPATVRAAGRRLRATVDPDGALASADRDFTRRRLSLSPMLDGMVSVDGLLDAEAAATVNTALAPFLVPVGPEDDRSTGQRRADGLVELARLALDHATLGQLGSNPPRLEVACSLPTLIGQPGAPAAVLPHAPGGSAPLTRAQLERLGCSAVVARVLTDAAGLPMDLGRDARLFTGAQRKALAIRDGGCRFPGCGMPPAFTDAHHITSWRTGGETSLPNGVLLCRFHHRRVHEHGWTIRIEDTSLGANGPLTIRGPTGQRLIAHAGVNPRAP